MVCIVPAFPYCLCSSMSPCFLFFVCNATASAAYDHAAECCNGARFYCERQISAALVGCEPCERRQGWLLCLRISMTAHRLFSYLGFCAGSAVVSQLLNFLRAFCHETPYIDGARLRQANPKDLV